MATRRNPTARQIRLGTELRRLREAAGLKAREAATLLGADSVQMSQIESGASGVSEERVRRMAANYACGDPALIDALVSLATDRTRGWWEEYLGILPPAFLDLTELDHHATFRRDVEFIHVPGLLQTEDYARALFSYMVPELPKSELEPRVEHRMRRRTILDRDNPTAYEAVIHEAALRIRVSGREAARSQLARILDASTAEHVTVRVIPFDLDNFAGASSAMMYAGGAVPRLDTVLRDAPHGSAFLDSEAQLARFRTLFHKVGAAALDPKRSRDLIHQVIQEL
ncbi:helix-turn-helix transcriptional regulator [Streptomyces sp. NPDC050264]|uniref:helix-turn-helix domain-containing protein n=1 Tax=Streptomyces sp. NPDC050264 TaxID=3155038 RepID=UPI0034186631